MISHAVAVEEVEDIDRYEVIERHTETLLASLRDRLTFKEGATALIKVNLCLLMGPETGATVDFRVARALVKWLQSSGKVSHVIIAEADATHLNADMAFKALGWNEYFAQSDCDIEFCNLSRDKLVEAKTCLGRTVLMSEKYMTADLFISLAKLKTHSLQKISCNMKNLFGASPEKFKVRYHAVLTDAICEFTSVRLPDISMVDGLVAMDGKGPVNGFPRICRRLIAGTDILSTDHFCAKFMGLSPKRVPHIARAIELGIGSSEYTVKGDMPATTGVPFRVMPFWEEAFRNIIKEIREKKSGHGPDSAGNAPLDF